VSLSKKETSRTFYSQHYKIKKLVQRSLVQFS